MAILSTALLIIHIAGGGISLISGLMVVIRKKGTVMHRRFGLLYFYSMMAATLSALPLSLIKPNPFLFMIGIFSAYMLLTGRRQLFIRALSDVKRFDYLLSALMLLCGLGFMALGILRISTGDSFGVVFTVFGALSLLFVFQDWRFFQGKSLLSNAYLTNHLQRMTGSYIASVTAFLVVNNTLLPDILAWLLPTVLLTPLIISWSAKYGRKRKPDRAKIPVEATRAEA